jgi:hypothetical protein
MQVKRAFKLKVRDWPGVLDVEITALSVRPMTRKGVFLFNSRRRVS